MNRTIDLLWSVAACVVLTLACNTSESTSTHFSVANTLPIDWEDAIVYVETATLREHYPDLELTSIKFTSDTIVPFQIIDRDADGSTDVMALVVSVPANGSETITIEPLAEGETLKFQKRTQAEISHKINGAWQEREYIGGEFVNVDYLKPPPQHTDHSWFIRYEGPGWESDKVGYRFYLDWRNATDIFGKLTHDMVLQNVGLDGFDSYHEPGTWGMDILKVGESLGIGSLGTWIDGKALRIETTDSFDCQIVHNGDLESMIRTRYYGWQAGEIKTDVISELSIEAGSRLTRHDVTLSETLPNLCTGIVKDTSSLMFSNQSETWAYTATWGKQSLAGDMLGMAVLYKVTDLMEQTEDAYSHVVVLRPDHKKLTYYFLAAWEKEPGGITTNEGFRQYLQEELKKLGAPLKVLF